MAIETQGESANRTRPGGAIRTKLPGAELELLPEGAAYWPAQQALLVADLHLGKGVTFRRHGLPVPSGSSAGTLATLSRALRRSGAARLWILGDLLHARSSLSASTSAGWSRFRDEHPDLRVGLVVGNHDRHAGPLPEAWGIESFGEQHQVDEVLLTHHPGEPPEKAELRIAGHLHPAVRLPGQTGIPGRLRCFWWSRGCLVLPAFGQFTGTSPVRPRPGDRLWLVADNELVAWRP